MRILYVQSVSETGGSDVCLLRMVESLDRTRFQVFVVLPSEGPLTESMRKNGATVYIVPSMLRLTTTRGKAYLLRYVLQYPWAIWSIAKIIRRERIDLVHSNTLHALHGFAAAWLTRRPHVWHAREIVLQSRAMRALESFLARRFSARIIAMGDAIAGALANPPPRLLVLREGIDIDQFHPRNDGSRIRAELQIPDHHRVAAVVCRLDHWKGVDIFLRAAALCRRNVPDVTYLVVGGTVDGRENVARDLTALAQQLGVDDVVRFTDWRYGPDAMSEVHAALDLLVLPSTWPEPYGLVLLEAMASGKPVVATRHGGPLEICVPGQTALLVGPGDVDATAAAMERLLADPERAQAMGKAARERVERDFPYTRYIERIQQTYDELLS